MVNERTQCQVTFTSPALSVPMRSCFLIPISPPAPELSVFSLGSGLLTHRGSPSLHAEPQSKGQQRLALHPAPRAGRNAQKIRRPFSFWFCSAKKARRWNVRSRAGLRGAQGEGAPAPGAAAGASALPVGGDDPGCRTAPGFPWRASDASRGQRKRYHAPPAFSESRDSVLGGSQSRNSRARGGARRGGASLRDRRRPAAGIGARIAAFPRPLHLCISPTCPKLRLAQGGPRRTSRVQQPRIWQKEYVARSGF